MVLLRGDNVSHGRLSDMRESSLNSAMEKVFASLSRLKVRVRTEVGCCRGRSAFFQNKITKSKCLKIANLDLLSVACVFRALHTC